MNRIEYDAFTAELQQSLAADDRILGLVALGSMADRDYSPDEWSDHDFFVVTRAGDQETFRNGTSWLPASGELVMHFRETAHGVKALYASGHLVEFAVFDLEELRLARVNRYRVVLDRGDVALRMEEVHRASMAGPPPSDEYLFGQFVTNLVVGIGRHRRGEKLSGGAIVKYDATRHLLVLAARHVAVDSRLDDLDPRRRFEQAHPEIAGAILNATSTDTLDAAATLVDLAERWLGSTQAFPHYAFDVLRSLLKGSRP